jgi:diaminopimelate decarboxylase
MELPALRLRGIHLHIGSQVMDAAAYFGALEVALSFLEEARPQAGFVAEVLDVGGGMAVAYRDEQPFGIQDLARRLTGMLERECRARDLPLPEMVVEPGRAVTSGAAVTIYAIGTIKRVPGHTYVNVDGGMSDNIRPALYGSRYTMALASRRSDASREPVTVVGRHCESGDVLGRDVVLPSDLSRGDLLAVASTGAYEYAMASNYNKVGRPAIVMVRDGEARLIVRRETDDDLARLDVDD